MTINAVIFDFDGTLVDSEPIYYEAEKTLFAEYGIHDFSKKDKEKYVGLSTREMMERVVMNYNLNESPEVLIDKKNRNYLRLVRNKSIVFPEMIDFIALVKKNNYHLCLASGSSKTVLDELLPMVGLADSFEVVLSSDQVQRGKPNPDIFLESARRMGIEPQSCLVIEDSGYGVEAAKRAGMVCMAVLRSENSNLPKEISFADSVIRVGDTGFSPEAVLEWIKSR